MAKKGMTILEVKKLRTTLESDILKLVDEFQNATGVRVSYIDMKWVYDNDRETVVPMESSEKRELKDVGVNLDFDALGV